MAKKKREEVYKLTFRGFVVSELNKGRSDVSEFVDALELWLRRIDCNAVILTKAGEFETHKVYMEEK